MALCDRLEAQQQERETRHAALARASLARFADAPTPANLQFLFHPSYAIHPADLRKSILTLAVQGKLVPQDPNDEPAETCCSKLIVGTGKLLDEQLKRRRRSPGYPGNWGRRPQGMLELPSDWIWTRIRQKIDHGSKHVNGERIPVSLYVVARN